MPPAATVEETVRVRHHTAGDLAAGAEGLDLGSHLGYSLHAYLDAGLDAWPGSPLVVVDLDAGGAGEDLPDDALERAADVADRLGVPVVGVTETWSTAALRLAPHLDLTLTTRPGPGLYAVTVPDAGAALARLARAVATSPRAAVTLCQLLRVTSALPVPQALVVESLAYSALLAGPEFRRWRDHTPRREPLTVAEPVRLDRDPHDTGRLTITLDHPARRNALGRQMRDAIVEAFSLAATDPTVREVHLSGNGPAFCSGGDLDEFGLTPDVATAHLIRTGRSPAGAIHAVARRTVAHLHGACVGAGIELPAFARTVLTTPDASLRLPEIAMGLIPGAGGTVSFPRRIGRWRTAYLALTGEALSGTTAVAWGLADRLDTPADAPAPT
jgi:enoyl-CoA hydratase/carnithine racemase